MYRIHFDPAIGQFIIQVAVIELLWRSVRGQDGKVVTFETFELAQGHVEKIGLSRLYRNKSADQFRKYIRGEVAA